VLYRRLIGAHIRAQMQYRISFLLMTLVSLVVTDSDLLAILILFNYFGELAGWRVGEVALLYGLAMVAFRLSEMVAAGFDVFPQAVQRREFDRVLLRCPSITSCCNASSLSWCRWPWSRTSRRSICSIGQSCSAYRAGYPA
jgi:ABC-2 type transport system permease protein